MNMFEVLLLPEDAPVLTQIMADVDDRGPREYRIRWRTNQGDILCMDGSAVARRSRTGEFVAAFCTLRDVTERIKNDTATRERVEAAREEERTRIARELHDEPREGEELWTNAPASPRPARPPHQGLH
jgi:signal transduction histidine kinase